MLQNSHQKANQTIFVSSHLCLFHKCGLNPIHQIYMHVFFWKASLGRDLQRKIKERYLFYCFFCSRFCKANMLVCLCCLIERDKYNGSIILLYGLTFSPNQTNLCTCACALFMLDVSNLKRWRQYIAVKLQILSIKGAKTD